MSAQTGTASSSLNSVFNLEANPPSKSEKPKPFSIRLTRAEREVLKAQAGRQPLGSFIRDKLLADQQEVKRRSYRIPIGNEPQIAALLAELGRSHIASNLNQLARAANIGTLEPGPDTERDLREACQAVLAMRDALLIALNMKGSSTK